ncbi:ribosomal protection-like ABC-F family protein [Paenibacillus sp. Marseille-Q4541]|uniref:ribosomal protection-like ABC-F family protein n=1 Tax=Paenibacillus sp. Marseille-Q4541 TaxID=2831522 RepID=UPI001BAD82C9|nr:ABC-F family ATP-binding cassette domain-containing protein [Paenibacillus sp. Marseille-Q4541]
MIIVNGQQLKKYHGANLVLDNVTFEIKEGEKVGLIGVNGSGKSTLLSLISKMEKPDSGMLAVKKEARVGYLPQIPVDFEQKTGYEVLAHGFQDLLESRQQMTRLEQQMGGPEVAADQDVLARLLHRYAVLQEQYEREGGYEMDASIDMVATGLQIDKSMYARNFSTLSGGEKTRIVLASQLIRKPELLLLDEPTNHLDLSGVEWLEQFLRNYPGACILVSHDRYFLDRVVTGIIELEDGEAFSYSGTYSRYVKAKEERLLQQFAEYQEQQKKIKKMKETIRQLEEWGRVGGNEKFFRRANSIRKALARMEQVKKPTLVQKTAAFGLRPDQRSGQIVLMFEALTKQYGDRAIFSGLEGMIEYQDKIALLGTNGSGKTTFFKLLLDQEVADEGFIEWGAGVSVGYLAQQEEIQQPKQTVLAYFREHAAMEEGEARSVLAKYMFYGPQVFREIGKLSGGEWSRLRLAILVNKKPNVLLLDEPTNHLDITSREALEEALEDYKGTILAVSHDRYFINRLAEKVWSLDSGKLSTYLGNYDDYAAKRNEQR